MKDGIYQVLEGKICAFFVVKDGKIVNCAPCLRRRIEYWKKVAKYIGEDLASSKVTVPF